MTITLKNLSVSITLESVTVAHDAPHSPLAAALMAAFTSPNAQVEIHRAEQNDEGEPNQPQAEETTPADTPADTPAEEGAEQGAPAPDGNGATAPAAQPATPEVSRTAIIAFLVSDPRYNLRTFSSIRNRFGIAPNTLEADDLYELLDDMVANGALVHKTRRSDGAALYSAA